MSRKARHQRLHSETAQDSGGRLPYEGVLNPIGLDLAEERVGYHPAAVNHGNERGGPSFGGKQGDEQNGRRRVVVTSGESGGRHHVVLTNGSGESGGRHRVVLTNGSGESSGQHHGDVRSGRTHKQSHRQSLADKYGSDERRECPSQAANNDSSEQRGRERLAEKYGSSEQSYEAVQSGDEGEEEEEAESGKRSRPRDLMVYYR